MSDTATKEDLQAQLEAAKKSQDAKLKAAHDHLFKRLDVMADQYLSAHGIMKAASTITNVYNSFGYKALVEPCVVVTLATDMAEFVCELSEDLATKDAEAWEEQVLDKAMNPCFAKNINVSSSVEVYAASVARELMVCDVLSFVNDSMQDILTFRTDTDAAIEKLQEELAKTDDVA